MLRFTVLALCVLASASALPNRGRIPPQLRAFKRQPPTDPKIVGGSNVRQGEIPFQLSWQDLTLPAFPFHFCGGAIYDANTVLTAAHCCDIHSDTQVVAGEIDLTSVSGNEQTLPVTTQKRHENYGAFSHENDICVLGVQGSFEFNSNVAAVDMPVRNSDPTGDAQVSGWGTLSSGGSSPDIMQVVTVPILTDAQCRASNYDAGQIYDSMICAGEKGKDSCQGDSGGPLFQGNTHIGVVSWGVSCAADGYPGVYTQTSYFVDWLSKNSF